MNRQSDEEAAQHPTLALGVLLAADAPCLDTPTPSLSTLVPTIGNVCAEAAGMCAPWINQSQTGSLGRMVAHLPEL